MLFLGGGGAFVSPRSIGASWTISSLISEVTTRVSEVEIVVASWVATFRGDSSA